MLEEADWKNTRYLRVNQSQAMVMPLAVGQSARQIRMEWKTISGKEENRPLRHCRQIVVL